MTRIFTDGAEMQDVLFWDNYASVSIGSGGVSPYYYQCSNYCMKNFTSASEVYLRVRATSARRRADEYFIQLRSSTNMLVGISSNGATGYWYTNFGTTTVTFVPLTWYLIEIYFKLADAGGRFVLKIDGNIAFDYTGDTNPSTYTGVDNFYSNMYDGQTCYLDDLALNNTDNSDGKNDNFWCGDGVIVRLAPSGSSATANDWLNSGSVSGSANYLYVDEYPNDGDTTYVYASASSTGLQTQFSLSDFNLTGANITRIWAEGRAKKSSANPYGVKIGELASGGTDAMSGSKILGIGAYTRIIGNEAKVNPVTSASWTQANISGLELVLEIP